MRQVALEIVLTCSRDNVYKTILILVYFNMDMFSVSSTIMCAMRNLFSVVLLCTVILPVCRVLDQP